MTVFVRTVIEAGNFCMSKPQQHEYNNGKKFSMNLNSSFYPVECNVEISILQWFM